MNNINVCSARIFFNRDATSSFIRVQFCLCPGVRKNISILRVFHKWPMNYRSSFIPKTSILARRDPLLSSQTSFVQYRGHLSLHSSATAGSSLARHGLGKTSSFSLTAVTVLVTPFLSVCIESALFPRGVLIYWSASLSPPLNATTQNANDTFMNSHAIHNYETALAFSYSRVPAYIVKPAFPLHANNRDIHSPLL